MRRPLVFLGLVLILIGSVLAFIGPWKETTLIPATLDQDLTISDEELFYVDGNDFVAISAELGRNSSAEGYFRVYYGSIRFFVVDEENFQEWRNGRSYVEFLFEYEDAKNGKFTLRLKEEGEYHFVFDNTGREKLKRVYFEASAQWVESGFMETIRNNFLPVYVGIASLVCGIIIVIVGLRTQEEKSRYHQIREMWLGKGA
jgi:uncharacterized membrane protein